MPIGGRAITLYERVFPFARYWGCYRLCNDVERMQVLLLVAALATLMLWPGLGGRALDWTRRFKPTPCERARYSVFADAWSELKRLVAHAQQA